MGSNFFFARIRIIAYYGTEQFLETLISIIKSYDDNPDKKKTDHFYDQISYHPQIEKHYEDSQF